MLEYRLKAARREDDGTVSPPMVDVPIPAANGGAAIAAARAYEVGAEADRANVIWLADPAGIIIWSLRREAGA